MAESPTKLDDGLGLPRKAGYKSWKKKYRKMRITFEQKMQVGEEIVKQEAKAAATVKRLAIENDRLLDILRDNNNCPQIPPEKRIDVALPPSTDSNVLSLSIDRDYEKRKQSGLKRLEDLLNDVPHLSYAAAKDSNPSLLADLEKAESDAHPAHFLTPDDIDDYLHLIDTKLDPAHHVPTLAPLAHPNDHPPLHPLLRNPNSSTSWLRRHAPHIFLQGHEGDTHAAEDDETASHHTPSSRKARGGAKGDRGGKASSARGKRGGAAASRVIPGDKPGDWDASMDDDRDATPAPKGKRKRDDDPGYRPKGGSGSRPSKKKRRSEGGADGATPTAKKSKKGTPAPAAGDD